MYMKNVTWKTIQLFCRKGDLFRSAMLILPTLLLGLLHCNSFMNIYIRSTLIFPHAACHSVTFDEYNIAFFKFCFLICLPPAVPTALLLLLPLVHNKTIEDLITTLVSSLMTAVTQELSALLPSPSTNCQSSSTTYPVV